MCVNFGPQSQILGKIMISFMCALNRRCGFIQKYFSVAFQTSHFFFSFYICLWDGLWIYKNDMCFVLYTVIKMGKKQTKYSEKTTTTAITMYRREKRMSFYVMILTKEKKQKEIAIWCDGKFSLEKISEKNFFFSFYHLKFTCDIRSISDREKEEK